MKIKLFIDLYLTKLYKKKLNKCIDINCIKNATYNYQNNTKRYYCKIHKLDNMVDIAHKKCIECNIKRPNYNYENEKKALYCNDCKIESMVSILHYKCIDCKLKRPSFNYKNEKKALYCSKCKLDNMIVIINIKKCIVCKIKSPSCNYKDKTELLYCGDCKLDNMVNVKNKKCIKCNIKQPIYNYENEKKALYCNDCKKENMINIKDKKCIICKNKTPIFNYENEKQATHCNKCKLQYMIDINHKKCLNGWCLVRGDKPRYKGYCCKCFMVKFPNEPIIRNYKIKEKHMTDYIKEEFKDINLIYDKELLCGCSKRRPDVFIDLFNYTIVIECDENQHKSKEYEEEEREWDIYDDLAKRPIIFIRFNPDSYKDEYGKKIKSCFKICKTTGIQIVANKKKFNKRLLKLKETIEYHLENKPKNNINIIKLYYDK